MRVKRVSILMLSMVMLVSLLTGCGGGTATEASQFDGVWNATKYQMSGMDVPIDVIGEMVIEFKSGGNLDFQLAEDSFSGKYIIKADNENEIDLQVDGQEMPCTLEDGVLIVDLGDFLAYLVKEGSDATVPTSGESDPSSSGDGGTLVEGDYYIQSCVFLGEEYKGDSVLNSMGIGGYYVYIFDDGTAEMYFEEQTSGAYDGNEIKGDYGFYYYFTVDSDTQITTEYSPDLIVTLATLDDPNWQ